MIWLCLSSLANQSATDSVICFIQLVLFVWFLVFFWFFVCFCLFVCFVGQNVSHALHNKSMKDGKDRALLWDLYPSPDLEWTGVSWLLSPVRQQFTGNALDRSVCELHALLHVLGELEPHKKTKRSEKMSRLLLHGHATQLKMDNIRWTVVLTRRKRGHFDQMWPKLTVKQNNMESSHSNFQVSVLTAHTALQGWWHTPMLRGRHCSLLRVKILTA